MLGKEHILTTSFLLVSLLIILLFSFFNSPSSFVNVSIFTLIFNAVKTDYLYLILFSFGMMISATVPDVDISSNLKGLKIWNKIVSFGFRITELLFGHVLGKNTFSHRHINHSLFGAIGYVVSIIIFFIIVLALILLAYNILITHTIILSLSVLTESLDMIVQYRIIVFWFVFGAFCGFMAHLFEDSLTVSGINYFPGILHKRIYGKFITVSKSGYRDSNGEVVKVGFLSRSIAGAYSISFFTILFDIIFIYFKIYMFPLYIVVLLFLFSLYFYSFIFCGLRLKKDYY